MLWDIVAFLGGYPLLEGICMECTVDLSLPFMWRSRCPGFTCLFPLTFFFIPVQLQQVTDDHVSAIDNLLTAKTTELTKSK
jgi:hypothetical protein